jgi:hypothetical protein
MSPGSAGRDVAPAAPPPGSSADTYRVAMDRTVQLFARITPNEAIPATPAWSARELLAHLVGVAADVVDGNVGQYAQPSWTRSQVDSRRDQDLNQLLGEWIALVDPMCDLLTDPTAHGLDESFSQLPLIDLLAHEHDLREAIGTFGFSDPMVWPAVEARRHAVLSLQHSMAGLPSLEVRTPDGVLWTIGDGPAETQVVADRYELWRSLEGRRPRSTVRGFDWSADPELFLDHWPGFVFEWVAECEF